MNLYFDLRLRYFVTTPGSDTALESLKFKAGDGEEIVLQYGRSSDSATSGGLYTSPTWTAELLSAGYSQTIGIKASGDYSDGDILCSTSTFVEDATAKTYTGTLDFNTTEINTLLQRGDADDTDDVAAIEDALLELTFKSSASAAPRSSVEDVTVEIKHDIIYGDEGTPVNAGDPDQYSLVTNTIQYLPSVSSQVGGTSADLDSVATTSRTAGESVAFMDDDESGIFRVYELVAGTDAESAPEVIRPDDYAASTNEKVWKQRNNSVSTPDYIELAQTGTGTLTGSTWTKRSLIEITDTGNHCSMSSGAFALSTGTYDFECVAIGYQCDEHLLRLRNTTTASTKKVGVVAESITSTGQISTAHLSGRLTVSSASDYHEIQHWCATTKATDGQSGPSTSSGETPAFALLRLWKIS